MFDTGQSSRGKGHRLGDGSADNNEPMDVGGDKDEDEEDMDQDGDDMNVLTLPLRGLGNPPPGRPHPLARGANRGEAGVFISFFFYYFSIVVMVKSHKLGLRGGYLCLVLEVVSTNHHHRPVWAHSCTVQ